MIKSYGFVTRTRDEVVRLALEAANDKDNAYKLGAGARDPRQADPYSNRLYGGRRAVDCSGFVCHTLGFDKFLGYEVPFDAQESDEVWVYTDTIQQDALLRDGYFPRKGFPRLFRLLTPSEEVLPGDVLVYDSYYPNGGERVPGHCGIITRVLPRFVRSKLIYRRGVVDSYNRPIVDVAHPDNWFNQLEVAHATPSHRTKYGNVVAITNAKAWRPVSREGKIDGGYIVRYVGLA